MAPHSLHKGPVKDDWHQRPLVKIIVDFGSVVNTGFSADKQPLHTCPSRSNFKVSSTWSVPTFKCLELKLARKWGHEGAIFERVFPSTPLSLALWVWNRRSVIYSSVPNKRAGLNKRAGWNFGKNQISVQGGTLLKILKRVQRENWQFYLW